jgi:hypothetical protein
MEDTWEAFVKIYKEAKLFKNHGWIHLEKMLMVMPVVPNGPHVFFPSQGLLVSIPSLIMMMTFFPMPSTPRMMRMHILSLQHLLLLQ